MKNNVNRKNINVDKKNVIPLWNFKQEDDTILKLALYKETIPFDITGQTIVLGAKRPNNSVIEQTDGFTISGNEIDIALKNNILAVNGLVELDLQITDVNGKLTTASFFIIVAKKVLGENNLNASNDISAINKVVNDLKSKEEQVNKIINDIKPKADKLMNDIKSDYNSLQRIIIDENQAANLQDQINKSNEQLDNKASFNTNNNISATRIGRIINDGSNNKLSNPQGFCFDGINYYCAYRQYFGTGDDTVTKIVKYDIDLNEISSVINNYGHGNSICVEGDFIYICDINTKVYKLRKSDLSYVSTINIPYSVTAITSKNNIFYLLGSNRIYVTTDFNIFSEIEFILPPNSGISQGFEFDGEYFYMLRTSPNTILRYNLKGELIYINRLPLYADNVFKIGEVEDLSIIGNDIFFTALIADEHNLREITSIFKCNLKQNITGNTSQSFIELLNESDAYSVYVDSNNTSKNPLGNYSNPFPSLYEALALTSSGFTKNNSIYIKESNTNLDENIQFVGLHNNIRIESLGSTCKIKNLILKRCNATLINIDCDDVKLEEGMYTCTIGFNSLRGIASNITLYGELLNSTSLIDLYGSTLNGVSNLNVKINDYGCHGIFNYNTNMTIGDTFTNNLVEKAKVILLNIKLDTKFYTCQINGTGIRELNVTNIFNGSDGYVMASFHVTRSENTLTFDDVREINNAGVAKTTSTPNENYKINGITFIL